MYVPSVFASILLNGKYVLAYDSSSLWRSKGIWRGYYILCRPAYSSLQVFDFCRMLCGGDLRFRLSASQRPLQSKLDEMALLNT